MAECYGARGDWVQSSLSGDNSVWLVSGREQ